MGPYGSDLAQNYTQLLQIGFPTRFDGSRGPNTLIFEFLKSCNFQKIAGGGPGHPPCGDGQFLFCAGIVWRMRGTKL